MIKEMIVTVTHDGQLELPAEIKEQFRAGDEYQISVTEDSIVIKKVQPPLTWKELSRRIEAQELAASQKMKPSVNPDEFLENLEQLEPDLHQPTMEEICEIVREVRREMREKT